MSKQPLFSDAWAEFTRSNAARSASVLRILSEFTGAHPETIKEWLRGKIPKGIYLLQLKVFLHSIEQSVLELESLKPEVRELAEALAYSLFELRSAAMSVGCSRQDGLLAVVHGKEGVSERRLATIRALVKGKRLELDALRKSWAMRFREVFGRAVIETPSNVFGSDSPFLAAASTLGIAAKSEIIKAASSVIKGILPFFQYLDSNSFTEDDRRRLREECGEGTLFHLSTTFNRLCSESARRQYSQRSSDQEPTPIGVRG